MRRVLFVGDPHVTPDELPDCVALMEYVEVLAKQQGVDEVCVLGDLHHTHNVIRAEVLAFWRRYSRGKRLLVGNHDYAGEGSDIHALLAYEDIATVIDRPVLDHGILHLPYFSDRTRFLKECQLGWEAGGRTLVCHQTFQGSQYENGMYAPDGVEPELVPQENIISGHIHAPQSFGRVTYLGAPRWRTLSDANTVRALWLYEFDGEGRVVSKTPFDTGDVCRQIRYVLDTPDDPFDGVLDPRHDWRVDVRGPADYVETRKIVFSAAGARVRTFKTEIAAPKVRESEGIGKAFRSYLTRYTPKYGTPTDTLATMATERLGV